MLAIFKVLTNLYIHCKTLHTRNSVIYPSCPSSHFSQHRQRPGDVTSLTGWCLCEKAPLTSESLVAKSPEKKRPLFKSPLTLFCHWWPPLWNRKPLSVSMSPFAQHVSPEPWALWGLPKMNPLATFHNEVRGRRLLCCQEGLIITIPPISLVGYNKGHCDADSRSQTLGLQKEIRHIFSP